MLSAPFQIQPFPLQGPAATMQFTGPTSSNFFVQISTDLRGWTNLYYDSFTSNTYLYVDLQTAPGITRFYRGVLGTSPIQLQSNTVANVNPMTLVQIYATGLTTNVPTFVQFMTPSQVIHTYTSIFKQHRA